LLKYTLSTSSLKRKQGIDFSFHLSFGNASSHRNSHQSHHVAKIMGSKHVRYDSVVQADTPDQPRSVYRIDDGEVIQDESAQPEARESSLHSKESIEDQIETPPPIQPTHIYSTIPEEIEPADLVTPDPLTTIPPLTPDPVTPDQSKPSAFWSSSFGVSVRKGGRDNKDHSVPESEEAKPIEEANGRMAVVRDNKMPLCRYGTHRRLNQLGDDVKNKVCKFHKSRKGKDKQWLECE